MRKNLIPLGQAGIPVHFGDDRRSGNGAAARIPINQSKLLYREIHLNGIDQEIIWPARQCLHGAPHSQTRSLINVDLIYLISVSGTDCPAYGTSLDMSGKLLALSGVDDFAVTEALDGSPGIKDDRRCGNRTEEASAANFIHARDA